MPIKIELRSRVEVFKGSNEWREVRFKAEMQPGETAAILCDLWDRHWCASATRRCAAIARKVNRAVESLRARGVLIVHAPSETMEFYKDSPSRRLAQSAPQAEPPENREIVEPALPIDDSDGGCDDAPQCRMYQAWKRQHPSIRVDDRDAVSDNGREVYNLLKDRGVRNLLVMGVHTNMCVLGRSFAIRQMTRWGMRCILVRDLTDTMYNPRKAPFVPHDRGTELVIEHIEKHWCPTAHSSALR